MLVIGDEKRQTNLGACLDARGVVFVHGRSDKSSRGVELPHNRKGLAKYLSAQSLPLVLACDSDDP